MPVFMNFARRETRMSYYRGISSVTASGQIASEVESRKMRGTLIELVPTICALAFTPVPSDLPNPFALEL